MHKLLISVLAIGALNACTDLQRVSTEPRASVYKYVGSVQCKGGGTPLSAMMRQLSEGGVPVFDVSCGTDGKMYMAMCGAADGRIGILEVPEAKVSAAAALGFAPLSSLPAATKTVCPKAS